MTQPPKNLLGIPPVCQGCGEPVYSIEETWADVVTWAWDDDSCRYVRTNEGRYYDEECLRTACHVDCGEPLTAELRDGLRYERGWSSDT